MSLTSSLANHPGSDKHISTEKKLHFQKKGPKDKSFDPIIHRSLRKDENFTKKGIYMLGRYRPEQETKELPPFKQPANLNQFSMKVVQKQFKDQILRQELSKKYCCKTNAQIRTKSDLLERVYIEDPPELKGMKTVLDIDPDFFTIVEGRPIAKPFSMSKYLEDIRNTLRTRLMVGFRNDEMLLIDEKLKREKKSIENIQQKYQLYLNCFEQFLSEDYNESMDLLRRAEKASMETMQKADLIHNLHIENSAIEFEVHKLEERWRDLKMYQKFLYFVSPISWRKQYDYIHRDNFEKETSGIFKKYQLGASGQFPSLTNLVEEYLECIKQEEEPVLYFTKTVQLVKVFRFIEIQNLNCLLHTEEIQVPMENMRIAMEEAKTSFLRETRAIQDMINQLNQGIIWEEACSNELKDMAMKHIDGTFRKLVSDDDVLKLHVFVEDVYEAAVGKNDSELTIQDMMIGIEQSYNNLVLKLDGLPQTIVKKAEKLRFSEQARLAKLCEETAQKIALVESITWRLKKSLEPPFVKKRELKWRSAPPEKTEAAAPPPRGLTDKEKEYLTFFTMYCAHTDHVEDYGIDLDVSETDLKQFSVLLLEEEKPEPL